MAKMIPSICDGNVAYIPPQEGDCTLIEKSITENGIYRAFDDGADGYSIVTANVPNSYEASDEGKVVQNGTLVSQGSQTITQNGTYDTTLNDEVVVNVSGGGGGSNDNFLIACGAMSGSIYDTEATSLLIPYGMNENRGITGVEMTAVSAIGSFCFYSCYSLSQASFPACISIGTAAFQACSALTTASFPACTSIGKSAFRACSALTTASFPACTFIGSNAFQACSALTTASFPACTSIASFAFQSCSSLLQASFPACTSIGESAFYSCRSLESLYLLASSVVSLASGGAFRSTPMSLSSYLGSFGSIYVPASLVDAYKSATNWSAYSDRITAYEG